MYFIRRNGYFVLSSFFEGGGDFTLFIWPKVRYKLILETILRTAVKFLYNSITRFAHIGNGGAKASLVYPKL